MLDHPSPPDLLAAYVDAELDPVTTAAITAHLAGCAQCRADVEAQRRVKVLLRPASDAPVPADLAVRLRAGVYPAAVVRPVGRAWRRPRPVWAGWMAAPVLAAALLLAVLTLDVLRVGPFAGQSAAAEAVAMGLKDHAMYEQAGGMVHGYTGTLTLVMDKLSGEMKMPIAVPAAVPPGYHFDGGHDVMLDKTAAAHLAWMSDRHMLSLYQGKDPGGDAPAGWQALDRAGQTYWAGPAAGERALFWRQDGMLFLLCGNLPDAQLLDLAGTVANPHP